MSEYKTRDTKLRGTWSYERLWLSL